jgi:NAD(P)-dependent dehydrogenase (short-subunit alcohol dehydrogenase family)
MSDLYMPDAFAGKTVFIAGGSSGINLGIGLRFAELGAHVSIISRDAERVAGATKELEACGGGQAMGRAADVRDYGAVEESLKATYDRFGPIDVLVSGAAGNFLAPVVGLSANAFRTVVEIDLIGTFNVFRASWEYLAKPGASLLAITAAQGARPTMFQSHACAAKAGINLLTQTLAMEWGPAGVRVNAIAPGPIADTVGMAKLAASDEVTAAIKQRIPLRDYGNKRNIADMAVFLASANASYVTGAIIDCDGGMILGDASADALVVPART